MTTEATETKYLLQPSAAVLGAHGPKPTSITDGQTEAARVLWQAEGGRIDTGLWEATAGTFTATRDGYTEICTLLSGRVTITGEGEEPVTYGPGDIIVMPSGWSGEWEVHETVRKHYTVITD